MQQVEVFRGDLQAAGPAYPHHVGAQVREHHRGVRSGSDAAKFQYFHPGEGPRVAHRSNVTQLSFSHSESLPDAMVNTAVCSLG